MIWLLVMSPDPCFMRRLLPHITTLKNKIYWQTVTEGSTKLPFELSLNSPSRITTRIESNGHLTVWPIHSLSKMILLSHARVLNDAGNWCPHDAAFLLLPCSLLGLRTSWHVPHDTVPHFPSLHTISLFFHCCNYAENTTKPEGLKCPWNVQTKWNR